MNQMYIFFFLQLYQTKMQIFISTLRSRELISCSNVPRVEISILPSTYHFTDLEYT